MHLHYSHAIVKINNESWKIITFGMNKPENIYICIAFRTQPIPCI